MPAVGEQAGRFDALDVRFKKDMFVARMGNASTCALAGRERLAFQVCAKPRAELFGIGEGAPDALAWSVDENASSMRSVFESEFMF
jgi:hypothetical protein